MAEITRSDGEIGMGLPGLGKLRGGKFNNLLINHRLIIVLLLVDSDVISKREKEFLLSISQAR